MTTTSKADPRAHVAFHLTGVCMEKGLESIEELRPALFASYRDLASLRYDFPVVLLRNPSETPFVSLSGEDLQLMYVDVIDNATKSIEIYTPYLNPPKLIAKATPTPRSSRTSAASTPTATAW